MVSSSKEYYNIIQYGDILETVGDAAEQRGLEVDGRVSLSPTAHKMSAKIDFDTEIYAQDDDPINLGLKVRSGHSGFHGLKYDVGAVRQVCSNGMMAFISDLHFDQTHGEQFQPGLAYNAVDAVVESPEVIEERLAQAQNRELMNRDEALLVLLDAGLDRFLDQPVPDLLNALHTEVEDPENPSLYETYNAGTRALTHYSGDVPDYELDRGFENLSRLLESGRSEVPDPDALGRSVVDERSRELVEQDEGETYWGGEEETLRELRAAHELSV